MSIPILLHLVGPEVSVFSTCSIRRSTKWHGRNWNLSLRWFVLNIYFYHPFQPLNIHWCLICSWVVILLQVIFELTNSCSSPEDAFLRQETLFHIVLVHLLTSVKMGTGKFSGKTNTMMGNPAMDFYPVWSVQTFLKDLGRSTHGSCHESLRIFLCNLQRYSKILQDTT